MTRYNEKNISTKLATARCSTQKQLVTFTHKSVYKKSRSHSYSPYNKSIKKAKPLWQDALCSKEYLLWKLQQALFLLSKSNSRRLDYRFLPRCAQIPLDCSAAAWHQWSMHTKIQFPSQNETWEYFQLTTCVRQDFLVKNYILHTHPKNPFAIFPQNATQV